MSRLQSLTVGAVVVVAAAATGIAGTAAATAPVPDPATSSAPAAEFPVTVEHFFGATTIEEAPERVVTLGVTDADVVLALGVTPVGFSGFAFLESGFGPWAEPLIDGELPQRLDAIELNLEAIAALDPDLIIGVSNGFDDAMYAQLAEIAPTVARPTGTAAYQVPRPDATAIIAEALGVPELGAELEANADALIATAIAEHPEFAGKTGVVVSAYDGIYGAYTERDGRGQVMANLGIELPEAIAELDNGEDFFVELSREQVGLLDADVLVMLANEAVDVEAVENDAVLQALPVVAEGRMIVLDVDTRAALTSNTVLSIPFAVEQLVPQLAEVLAD